MPVVFTGYPFYDEMISGFLYIPGIFGDWVGAHDISIPFWMGIVMFFGCALVLFRLVFGWE